MTYQWAQQHTNDNAKLEPLLIFLDDQSENDDLNQVTSAGMYIAQIK